MLSSFKLITYKCHEDSALISCQGNVIGKLFNSDIEEPKNPKDKLLSGMKRVMGNSTFENWGYNAHPKGGLVPELLADANYP